MFRSKKKKIIIGVVAILLLIVVWSIVSYLRQPVAAVIKFNPQVSKNEAVAIMEKYGLGVSQREHIEYDNPFFSWLYPFEREGHQGISFETRKISAYLLKRKMEKEPFVKRVIVLSNAYSEARYYKSGFESLNPELTQ